MMRILLFLAALFLTNIAIGQDTIGDNFFQNYDLDGAQRPIHEVDPTTITNKVQLYEDSLVYFMDSLTFSKNEMGRQGAADYFIKLMRGMLKTPNSADYPFDVLKKNMNIIDAPDRSFRIFNWQMQKSEIDIRYYGVLQMREGKIYPLIDVSNDILRGAEDSILRNMKWYGALYYNIITQNVNGKVKYFLMGFNGNGASGNRKIVECMSFDNEQLVFGGPHFEYLIKDKTNGGKIANRFIAVYQKDAKMQLNWDKDAGMIIYDHLESTSGDISKRYSYAPDGTYDGLKWTGNGWRIVENAISVVPLPEGGAPVNINAPKKVLVPNEQL
jgi:hypothetical protein